MAKLQVNQHLASAREDASNERSGKKTEERRGTRAAREELEGVIYDEWRLSPKTLERMRGVATAPSLKL